MENRFENLAFRGAGVCGAAYAGVCLSLERNGILPGIKSIAGTSAGSIVAMLLCLKYPSKEIFDVTTQTNFKSFEDGSILDETKVFNLYGLHPGDNFLEWAKEKVKRKGLSETATFADFKNAGFLDLHVFAADVTAQKLQRFCFETTPDVPVVYAVRASMGIPLFFHAFRFPNNVPNNHIFVDGGCLYNYPLTAFDGDEENIKTLGFFIGDLDGESEILTGFGQFGKFIKSLFNTILSAQDINVKLDKEDVKRTVFISNCGISATNFGLTMQNEMDLFMAGANATESYFKLIQ